MAVRIRGRRLRSNFVVPDRAYIDVEGRDAVKLLQGICTNDVTDLHARGDCIAAAFLTPKGRVLANALIYNLTEVRDGDPSHLVIETHETMLSGLTKFLTMYRLRSKATIKATSSYQTVVTLPGHKDDSGIAEDALSVQDPRGTSLGSLSLRPLVANESSSEVDRSMYTRYRLVHGIAEGEEIANKIPLECNLDLLNYISFSKGCYVGQELVARTKHKGLVRKRILPFLRTLMPQVDEDNAGFKPLQSEIAEAMLSSDALDIYSQQHQTKISGGDKLIRKRIGNDEKEEAGQVMSTTSAQELGLAMVRLEKLFHKKEKGEKGDNSRAIFCIANSGNSGGDNETLEVLVFEPSWWPEVDPVTGKALSDVS